MRLRTAIRRVPDLVVSLSCLLIARSAFSAEPFRIDPVSQEQADLEKQALAKATPRTQIAGITEFRKTAQLVEYPSGHLKLPGWLYRAAGNGPFPAVMWNHGSEKGPLAQAELARFYTEHGFVFFEPIREGHGKAPGDYIGDLQKKILAQPTNANRLAEIVRLHERFNQNVVDAVAWLKTQPFIDRQRLVMSGVSYGGIQTMLSAEKGLGIRAFVPFAPGAMSWASKPLQERLEKAAKNSKAPVFLVQAENDFSTGPSERLGPILSPLGSPSGNKLYPSFGTTHERGHGAFACWSLGTSIWGPDVLRFIDASFKIPQPN